MPVAVGEPYGMVWEGVGSARGRPQAGRTSKSRREIARVVCHEAALESGSRRGTEREERREAKGETREERERERTSRGRRKNERSFYLSPRMAKGTPCGRDGARE